MKPDASKYKDMVSPEHVTAMTTIALAANLLTEQSDYLIGFLKAVQRHESVGAILDPTLFRDTQNSANFALTVRMVKVASAFVLAIQEIKAAAAAGETGK